MTAAQHVDADEIARLIAEALSATGELPPIERLVELDAALRGEIERLVPYVQRLADGTPHRTREWYAMVQAADRAEDALQFQLGTGSLAGAIHVAELARRVQELRRAGGVAA